MVSINALEGRKGDFKVNDWILDSGAFTRLSHGVGHMPVERYAEQILRWNRCGKMVAAVCQDYMCEPFVLAKTGLSVAEHQRRTPAARLRPGSPGKGRHGVTNHPGRTAADHSGNLPIRSYLARRNPADGFINLLVSDDVSTFHLSNLPYCCRNLNTKFVNLQPLNTRIFSSG